MSYVCACVRACVCVCVCVSSLPFGFESGLWDLIVLIPDRNPLSFTSIASLHTCLEEVTVPRATKLK